MTGMDLLERIICKITSGQFIFTLVVAYVYAYLAINQILKEDRIIEITLVVLYAYFTRNRVNNSTSPDDANPTNGNSGNGNGK